MNNSSRVVALGGGHGLAATLTALRSITHNITAVVTVADNGGSSGRLRDEFPIVPPGDLRMALAALCADDAWGRNWADLLQYRFTTDGPLDGHAVGNLLLTALWDRDADLVHGLDQVGSLLKVIGRVLPMSATPLDIAATIETVDGIREVRGQVQVATTPGKLQSISLLPENPQVLPEVIAAISEAEWITMGPGSWITSVLPHLLLPEVRDAIIKSPAKKILIINLDAGDSKSEKGEYAGYSPVEHIQLLSDFAPKLHFDYVLFDSALSGKGDLIDFLQIHKSVPVEGDLREKSAPLHHDPEKLASLFAHIEPKTLV